MSKTAVPAATPVCDPHLHHAILLTAGPGIVWGWTDLPRRSAHIMQPGPDVPNCTLIAFKPDCEVGARRPPNSATAPILDHSAWGAVRVRLSIAQDCLKIVRHPLEGLETLVPPTRGERHEHIPRA